MVHSDGEQLDDEYTSTSVVDTKQTSTDSELLQDSHNTCGSPGLAGGHYATKVSPPITLLQEICSRNGFTAEYQLLSTEGTVHEPTFKIAVTVADITVTASGQSKKKARHAAAREAIDKLRQRDLNFDGINFDSLVVSDSPTSKIAASEQHSTNPEPNPVGKLQEICMKMSVNPPEYETDNETGLAHERIFMMSCSIHSLKKRTVGEGRSKKLAKRQAADNMLSALEKSEIYDKSSDAKNTGHIASSLNLDADDNSQFVNVQRLTTKLTNSIEYTVDDLWTDIKMIETDNVNDELCYETLLETIQNIGQADFHYFTDKHCAVELHDFSGNMLASALGYGKDSIESLKNAIINLYKLIIALIEPLTGKESHLRRRAPGSLDRQAPIPCQEATAS